MITENEPGVVNIVGMTVPSKKPGDQHCRNDSYLSTCQVVNIAGMISCPAKITGWSTSREQVVRMMRMGGQNGRYYTADKFK